MPHTADCIIEAWGPDRPSCLAEALVGLVESFADISADASTTRVLPLSAPPGGEDALVTLLEDVIFALDVFSVVPVHVHLEETEEGGVAGDMEVVPVAAVHPTGPVPKGVSYHGLSIGPSTDGWRCHVLVDV